MTRFYLIALLLASVVSGNAAISLNRAPKASGGTLISESFENLEIHSAQLPQGWTRKNTMASGEAIDHWFATTQLSQCVEPQDGSMYMAVMFNSEYKDEWLISPEFTVTDNRVELN